MLYSTDLYLLFPQIIVMIGIFLTIIICLFSEKKYVIFWSIFISITSLFITLLISKYIYNDNSNSGAVEIFYSMFIIDSLYYKFVHLAQVINICCFIVLYALAIKGRVKQFEMVLFPFISLLSTV